MAAENLNKLKLAKIKKVYQHWGYVVTGGMYYNPSYTNVCQFFNFQLTFLSWYYTRNAKTLQFH